MAMDNGSGSSVEKEVSSRPVLITEGMAKRVGFVIKRKRNGDSYVFVDCDGSDYYRGKGKRRRRNKEK